MTALADAYEKAGGMTRRDSPIYLKAIKFIEEGGDRDQWMRIFDMAQKVTRRQADRDGRDQVMNVRTNQHADVPPVREPSPVQIAASLRNQSVVAKGLLATMKTSAGKPWGEVFVHELPGMIRDAKFAKPILDHLGGTVPNQPATLREAIGERKFAQIVRETEGTSNAVAH